MQETPEQRSTQPDAAAQELQSILAAARRARLTRTGVAEIAGLMRPSAIDAHAAVTAALRQADGHAATVLLVGAAMNGYQPEASSLLEFLPLLTELDLMAPLIGISTGDRLSLLLDLLESERLSWEREAFCILLAVELLGDAPPPARLLTQVRLLAREPLGPEAGATLGLAAERIQDPATREVAGYWIHLAATPLAVHILPAVRESLTQAPADALPETEGSPFAGYVMRRATPKTGRNDPCPCGSGRKYKKCCAEKDAARLADPSPVAGVTMSEYREQPEQYLDTSKFYELGVQEVARLDYSRLSTPCVIQAVQRLSHYRFWTEAEKAMEVLTIRTDLPSECRVDGYRAELINEALEARVRDVVQRQVALVKDTGVLDNIHLELELLTPDADTLSHLEEEAVEGMREAEGNRFLDLAYSLLDQFPALGILVARGALITDRPLDMEFLLERVERSRDRLQLSPGDLAQDLYECLIDRELANQADEDQTGDWNLADEASPATTSTQRKLLKETSAKVASLEKRLRVQEELLRKATAERKQMPAPQQPAKTPASMPFESEELKRLRAKVAELKGLISESHKERSGLRVQLADAMRKAEETALQPTRQQGQVLPAAQYVAEDTEELDAGMPGRWHMLVPTFRNAAREEIRSAPAPLARQALQAAAGLAAGDRSAWSGIKRLRRVSDVWSARIGLHHRLLFRLDAGRGSLEITAFIHRRDLESVIARGNL